MESLLEQINEGLENEKHINYEDRFFKNTVINNFIYKHNSVTSFISFLLYSFKESIFKNHYRSLKLEELLNSDELLPMAMLDSNNDIKNLIELLKEPYYQIRGIVKTENLFSINRLKELHKVQYINFFKKIIIINKKSITEDEKKNEIKMLQEKWLDPDCGESIKKYYFESNKSDPIIVIAKKFIAKSGCSTDPSRHDTIKLSVANMLKAATKLTDKIPIDSKPDFLEEIQSVLSSVVDILQPGLESELGYALCVKYSNKLSATSTPEDIYVFSSDKDTNGSQISPDGLIYHLMKGMFSSKELKPIQNDTAIEHEIDVLTSEQSLLTGIKSGDVWYSFADEYFVTSVFNGKNEIISKSFNDLLNKDLKTNSGEIVLPLLNDSNMNLFFRLSELDEEELAVGKCTLEGRAVLIISYKGDVNFTNYADFMSNEKVRLLLLVKEELLKYLKKMTETSAFNQLIKNENLLEYQQTLKHGLDNYFDYIEDIVDPYIEGKDKNINDTIIQAIKGQIRAYEISNNVKDQPFDLNLIIEKVKHILESNKIEGKRFFEKSAGKQFGFEIKNEVSTEFCFDSFIIEIVLIELIINAKQYSPRTDHDVEICFGENYISVKNKKKVFTDEKLERRREGLKLCQKICKELKYDIKIEGNNSISEIFQVTITKKLCIN